MKRFLSYIEEIRKQKKLTKTQLSLAAFGILLFLSLALALPNYLLKKQQILRSQAQEAQAPIEMGVNLAGADFCDTFPCTYGTNYIYPNASELDYYKSKGFTLIRLPFRWENMQPTLNGPLDSAELSRMQTFVSAVQVRGMHVILDAHNYARYKNNIIGSAAVPIAAFQDFWTKMAAVFRGNSAIFGYDLSNEPNTMGSFSWQAAAQAATNGIRTVDTTTPIIVEGNCWASALRWADADCSNSLIINDPAGSGKLLYEAHQYFDADSSGSYSQSYDASGAYPNIGVDRVMPFINWLKAHNYKGYIGEYGIPNNDPRWFTVLDNFLNVLKTNNIPGTYWAGGPWWNSCSYIIGSEPCNGADAPLMSTLMKYPSTTGTASATPSPTLPSTPTPTPSVIMTTIPTPPLTTPTLYCLGSCPTTAPPPTALPHPSGEMHVSEVPSTTLSQIPIEPSTAPHPGDNSGNAKIGLLEEVLELIQQFLKLIEQLFSRR